MAVVFDYIIYLYFLLCFLRNYSDICEHWPMKKVNFCEPISDDTFIVRMGVGIFSSGPI